MTSTLLQAAYKAIDDKHGEDIVVLNMQGISLLADYFIIAHGNSDRQVQAIARELQDVAEKEGYEIRRVEGFDAARWVLVDLGDVVAHVFHKDERAYYNLERLWGDAPQLDIPEA
ncbi:MULTISPECIES: ribosome silencing factor [Lysinibacillus]|uniref:Ribosomal silencing factor RsfS n=1 Tax=Lysinibacillus pakistanensis TaxID=759811 RepID=A0AAX3WQR6_9BACI|nr:MULTISPECIES: ribosome silencing factor [Lysinibacillus]AVK84230.1 ribosome silencing factor [Lysinibacillus sp. B2A1]MDM5234550.1 ribosome silencing factor [Lysinibacillus pakistanensis]QGG52440.1 ribosome silencing factor [Lysinibacillus pakistanensis]WHY45127.1 ribosome silencing factor [Lysinibacillus pakistanensis]WHY50136.1 ribosome silencing factor [Lysinibacillus pakistanensis]